MQKIIAKFKKYEIFKTLHSTHTHTHTHYSQSSKVK